MSDVPDRGGWFWYRDWPRSDVWRIGLVVEDGLVFDDGQWLYRVGVTAACPTSNYTQFIPIRDANDNGTENAGTWTAEELRLWFRRRREANETTKAR